MKPVFDVLMALLTFKDWVLENASRCVVDDVLVQWAEEEPDVEERFGFLAGEDPPVNEEVVVREDKRRSMELSSSDGGFCVGGRGRARLVEGRGMGMS
jgi:hypothetical protein